ncbi:MAG: DUF58 domain-containing protein [Clostridium sp.]|nr:DUF58 domain-containing protein [Clostridium sp.]
MIFQVFLIAIIVLGVVIFAEGFSNRRLKKISIKREVFPQKVTAGDKFNIRLSIENKNKCYIPFLIIEEVLPKKLTMLDESGDVAEGVKHVSRYSVKKFQRKIRTYTLIANNRGVYNIKNLKITLADHLGLSMESKSILDFVEMIVYPKVKKLSEYKFDSTNSQGDTIVKRWIYKDPIYTRGIREYCVEDRMKDIHWKSSLKANKLMVKEYDYTSSEKLVLILCCQSSNQFWESVNEDTTENIIDLAVSVGARASKDGVEVGIWSNSQLIYINERGSNEVEPTRGNFNRILEYCARISYGIKCDFDVYIESKINKFQLDHSYVLITPYLSKKGQKIFSSLAMKGYKIKLIDVSPKGDVPFIKGIEKIIYKGRN